MFKVTGEAEGIKIKAIGDANAEVTRKMTEAQGQENYAVVRVAEALSKSVNKWVPEIVFSGNNEGGSHTIADVLMGTMLKDAVKGNLQLAPKTETKVADKSAAPAEAPAATTAKK